MQSVELRIETPQARHEYVLTTSNQTLTLKKENSQSTIRADQCSSYTTVTNPWTMKALNRVQESKMMSDAQITQKVNPSTSFSYFCNPCLAFDINCGPTLRFASLLQFITFMLISIFCLLWTKPKSLQFIAFIGYRLGESIAVHFYHTRKVR